MAESPGQPRRTCSRRGLTPSVCARWRLLHAAITTGEPLRRARGRGSRRDRGVAGTHVPNG